MSLVIKKLIKILGKKIAFRMAVVLGLLAVCLQLHAQSVETLTVDQHGKGDFTTVQEAINSIRAFRGSFPVRIMVKKGIYREKVVIPSYLENLQLIGEDALSTKIVFDDYSGKAMKYPDETGQIIFGTFTSYTLLVRGSNVVFKDITIENGSGPVGQAVALHVEGDRIAFINCRILGFQDTLYLGRSGCYSYFLNCTIQGSTDFIFGPGISFFSKCKIISLRNSYVSAASTPQGQNFGYVFETCEFAAADSTVNAVFLGRPWRPFAQTVLVDCFLGKHILAAGWNGWKGDKLFPEKEKTVFYAELNSTGEGAAHRDKRVSWSHQLPAEKRETYLLTHVLKDWDIKKMLSDLQK